MYTIDMQQMFVYEKYQPGYRMVYDLNAQNNFTLVFNNGLLTVTSILY